MIRAKKINLKNKKTNFLDGTFKTKDNISVSYINNKNPKFIEIDEVFYSGIIIVNYSREYDDIILKK